MTVIFWKRWESLASLGHWILWTLTYCSSRNILTDFSKNKNILATRGVSEATCTFFTNTWSLNTSQDIDVVRLKAYTNSQNQQLTVLHLSLVPWSFLTQRAAFSAPINAGGAVAAKLLLSLNHTLLPTGTYQGSVEVGQEVSLLQSCKIQSYCRERERETGGGKKKEKEKKEEKSHVWAGPHSRSPVTTAATILTSYIFNFVHAVIRL